MNLAFDILNMCAIFPSLWVRKLIGQTRVPYNRGLRVRGSPHPYQTALASNVFRIQSDLESLARSTASRIFWCSSGDTLAFTIMPRFLAFGTFGLPILVFINTLCKTKIIVDRIYFLSYR